MLNVSIIGQEFGASSADIASILIGDTACLAHYYVSDSILTCTLPAGVGRDHDVVVVNALGFRSSIGA